MTTSNKISLDEFIEMVPKDAGWYLTPAGEIRITVDLPDDHCLTTWVNTLRGREELPPVNLECGYNKVHRTVDNHYESLDFDPTLRVRLLEHCGLVEVSK